MTNKEWALRYHAIGWSIFPLQIESKKPNGAALWKAGYKKQDEKGDWNPAWEPLVEKRASRECVEEWWSEYPDGNIALICGAISGINVVDIDLKRRDDKPVEDREKLACAYEFTMRSQTGGGGLHLFFNYQKTKGSVHSVHPQIDIKTDRGYVVLPPSIHDKTKRPYQWDPIFPFTKNNVKNLAEFPSVLLQKKDEEKEKVWADLEEAFHGVHEGSRNQEAARLIGSLIHRFADYGIQSVWDLIYVWNKERLKPPLPERELWNTFQSITRRHYANAKRHSRGRLRGL